MTLLLAQGWTLTSRYAYILGNPIFVIKSQDLEHEGTHFLRSRV
jgi:hypothetical protein